MSRFSWIITVPVTLLVVVFSVANMNAVTIDLWPLELTLDVPLFAIVLGSLLAGFVIGAIVMWISDGRTRNRARQNYYKASHLERELASLKRKQADAAPAASGSSIAAAPAPSGPNLLVAHQRT